MSQILTWHTRGLIGINLPTHCSFYAARDLGPSGPFDQMVEELLMADAGQTVESIMSRDVKTVGRNDALRVADELMAQERVRHLAVLDDDGILCGVVTQRDLFRGAILRALGYGSRAEDMVLDQVVVKEAMSEDPVTASPATTVAQAAALMLEHNVGCLPVVDGETLLGIVSEGDFVRLAL